MGPITTPNVVIIPVPFVDREESFFDLTVDSSRSTTGTGTATTFYIVTGPIIRQIKAFFHLYNRHEFSDNFLCRNGAGPSEVISKLSSHCTTGTRMATTFGVETGPISC
ncbi:hypothetical protein L484_000723 [Morus notabilis]|uniref:Uncharacterized protein n=1 Tax=Morus notabilis TaxID=981085 RepID=W9SPC0_9ROSA|nr:hypothetical protein L484_000723 [Morus notabilis]